MTVATDTEVKLDEKIERIVIDPGKWNVVLLNDDHTPMEFVIEVLMGVFTTLKQQLETTKIESLKESNFVIMIDKPIGN